MKKQLKKLTNYIKFKIKKMNFKPMILDGWKWYMIDLYRYVKYRDTRETRIKEHGVYLIAGRTGGGKTTIAVKLIDDMINKYGRDNIYIASNTDILGQDFKIEHWGDLTLFYNKPLVFLYDECNSDWTQNSYKQLDLRLRSALTQNRKGKSKMVLAITQDYGMLLNEWRRLAKKVYFCKTIFGRYTMAKRYDAEEYEELYNTTDIRSKMKIRKEKKLSLVQTDEFRQKYNSFALVNSIKKPFQDYVVRRELLDKIDYDLIDINDYTIEKD